MSDTQHIRNAYLSRPVEQIDRSFGDFACEYLGVNDPWLKREQNINAACNYILNTGVHIPTPEHHNVKAVQPESDRQGQTRERDCCSVQ